MENRELTDAEVTAQAFALFEIMKRNRRDKERNSGVQEKLSFARPILCKPYADPFANAKTYTQVPQDYAVCSSPDKDGKFTVTITAADGTVYPVYGWEEQEPLGIPNKNPHPFCGGAGCFFTTDGGVVHKMGCPSA